MSLPIKYLPSARQELDEAIDWLNARQPGLGSDFAEKVISAVAHIAAAPAMYAKVHRQTRCAPIDRFPHHRIYYREETGHLLVVAVVYTARSPRVWKRRAK